MINFDGIVKEHNSNWPQIANQAYRILIIGGFGYGNTNSWFNLINQQLDIDKFYFYAKNPYEEKYQFLIIKEKVQAESILMILKVLSKTKMICMIFMKILKNTT